MEDRLKQLEERVAALEGRVQEQPKEFKRVLRVNVTDGNANNLIKKHRQMVKMTKGIIGI